MCFPTAKLPSSVSRNKFDGKAGKHFFRFGKAPGTYNLWRKKAEGEWAFYKSVTMTELRVIEKKTKP